MIIDHYPDLPSRKLKPGLRAIGYWRDRIACDIMNGRVAPDAQWIPEALNHPGLEWYLPDPYDFVDATWDANERSRVVAYVQSGKERRSWRGLALCRFRCKLAEQAPKIMGYRCLSDGSYMWPEGFAHYLEAHHVRPPEEFVRHVLHMAALAAP
jgi:hypothetical protein